MGVELGAMTDLEAPGAEDLEDLVGAAQVRLRLDQLDAEIGEDAALGLEDGGGAGIDRQPAQVAAPGDARAAEIARQRPAEDLAGVVQAEREAEIRPGHDAHQQGDVADGARQGAIDGHVEPGRLRFGIGDAARRGTKADDVAVATGVAQGAAEVAAVGDGVHAGGQGDGRAAGGAARRLRQVVGIERRAEDGVERLRAGAELGDVRLADRDRARRPAPAR